ncbi:mitochondrial import inner membrane translocase subunit Tim10 B [Exaiptasia diaphana]|uniref:Mitochondrial import inner membrane translocase subunit n=1 Tax=Exaiptasia diaphana TaxID=2652724 RepID=A0A913Y5I0_EXADI|nr:mitochondrial import inner membrane translocase subunit Tim10 B [Exaiptasia diaphana]KXJ22427.1 Mitochondrial import inner membrane translocase subunit Tim10 B [Exaiptasia diaphana]
MNVPNAEEVATRNFREFLMLYNKLTESCFNSCVTNMNQRSLTTEESTCIEICSSKWVNLNHRQMAVFMEVGPLAEKRLGMGQPT